MTEQRARELLAAEYENSGFYQRAGWVRTSPSIAGSDQIAIRAITTALSASDGEKYRLMLLDLLAVIHRDGGHKTQEIGIKLAYEQALQLSSERIAALAELRRLSTQSEQFAESAKSPSDSGGETTWLIERRVTPPQWSDDRHPMGVGNFWPDVNRAYRFPTKQAAEDAMRHMRITPEQRGEYFVLEHKWIASATPSDSVREALAAQTAVVDRLCSAIERAENDIGGERVSTVLRELGPANDAARAALQSSEADNG